VLRERGGNGTARRGEQCAPGRAALPGRGGSAEGWNMADHVLARVLQYFFPLWPHPPFPGSSPLGESAYSSRRTPERRPGVRGVYLALARAGLRGERLM